MLLLYEPLISGRPQTVICNGKCGLGNNFSLRAESMKRSISYPRALELSA